MELKYVRRDGKQFLSDIIRDVREVCEEMVAMMGEKEYQLARQTVQRTQMMNPSPWQTRWQPAFREDFKIFEE